MAGRGGNCCRCGGPELVNNSYCRTCYNEWRRQRGVDRYAVISAIKQERGCADCGYNSHPAALHFDHLRDKTFNIGRNVPRLPWNAILEEIEKCDVVCANCHAVRTADRRVTV